MTVAVALWVVAAAPLAAQQAVGPTSPAGAAAAQASPAPAALPGPRLRPEWRRVEPSFADSSVTAPMAASAAAASHTITISTLTLVLVIIIVVLLIT
ncbi:MAG TPA: hypothetical protein VD707_08275 [Gemmatimonadales bacterium]|nr:hypothetical protein [Gemmatimonadales bacterium]